MIDRPGIYSADAVARNCVNMQCEVEGKWYLARPVRYNALSLWHRIRCAWLVFWGKRDVLEWREDR